MAFKLSSLLGPQLVTKDGSTLASDVAVTTKYVALYFSAHWCPPCRNFTPVLAAAYTDALKAKGVEVVFVSSDKTEEEWKDYYGTMPWLALPYADRDRKTALSKQFSVSGIPSLVLLDAATGKTLCKSAREFVADDPKGENLPWLPKTLSEMLGTTFVGPNGTGTVSAEALAGKKVGIYFSAHWCPPCKGFTPVFAAAYKAAKAKGSDFEVVFVSSDKSEGEFTEYHATMPWLAMPYANRQAQAALQRALGVNGIPALVIVDMATGKVMNPNARAAVESDPEAKQCPWPREAIGDLAKASGIDESLAFCVLADGCSAAEQDALVKELTPLALEKLASTGDDDPLGIVPEALFFISRTNTDLVPRVRSLIGQDEVGAKPKAVLLHVEDSGAFYPYPADQPLTKDAVQAFMASHADGTLAPLRQQMSQG